MHARVVLYLFVLNHFPADAFMGIYRIFRFLKTGLGRDIYRNAMGYGDNLKQRVINIPWAFVALASRPCVSEFH